MRRQRPARRRLFSVLWWWIVIMAWCAEGQTVTISSDIVNVRSGPGRTYDVIDVVARDEIFEVLEARDGWYRISVEGQIGWISAKSTAAHDGATIAELLAAADRYFEQRRLTTPADGNAFDLYQDVLRRDPEHSYARQKIADMARIYKRWAEQAEERGDAETARMYEERYRFVAPEAPAGIPGDQSGADASSASAGQPLQIYQLRTAPTAMSPEAMRQMIRAYHFHHPADWSAYGLSGSITGTIRHDYEPRRSADGTVVVVDYATNLAWQRSSPPTPVTWTEAQAYVQRLNRDRYGGHADWRLPTLEELASLLEPTKSANNLYLDPTFGATQLWCWSADPLAASPENAWYVSFSSGGIQPHHIQATAFVLAARTLEERL